MSFDVNILPRILFSRIMTMASPDISALPELAAVVSVRALRWNRNVECVHNFSLEGICLRMKSFVSTWVADLNQ